MNAWHLKLQFAQLGSRNWHRADTVRDNGFVVYFVNLTGDKCHNKSIFCRCKLAALRVVFAGNLERHANNRRAKQSTFQNRWLSARAFFGSVKPNKCWVILKLAGQGRILGWFQVVGTGIRSTSSWFVANAVLGWQQGLAQHFHVQN